MELASLIYGELQVQWALRGPKASAPRQARDHWSEESGHAVRFLYTALTLCYVVMFALYNSAWLRTRAAEHGVQAFAESAR